MIPTDQTLQEQMRIDDIEINYRKNLIDFTEDDQKLLANCKRLIQNEIDNIVSEFYKKITSIEEISLLIGDANSLDRLKIVQRKYIFDLFNGYYDNEYVNHRLRIGLVHKRIGVAPKLYLSAIKILKDILFHTIEVSLKDKSLIYDTLNALDKLIYFDITLVFDTYIRSLFTEVELAKQKAESYAKSLEEKVKKRTKQLEELSRRDSLTDLFNQRSLYEFLRRDILYAERNSKSLSLVYFDVDKFKEINDKFGHQRGDKVLKNISGSLINVSREVDVPCRYGGDEFCLILPNCTLDEAKIVCDRFLEDFHKNEKDVNISIGIAQTGPKIFDDPDTLIKKADNKMYKMKKSSNTNTNK